MKYTLLIFMILSHSVYSQTLKTIKDVFNTIESIDDLELVKPILPDWKLTDVIISPYKNKSESDIINSPLLSTHESKGNNVDENYFYKVIGKYKKEYCKVKYILVKSSGLNEKEINNLQDEIIDKYKSGTKIQTLVEEYNQDGNKTGELGWFGKNVVVPEFESAIWNKKINDIVKINIPSRNWYYVVFKTHSNSTVDVAHCVRAKICHVGCPKYNMEMPEKEAEYPGGISAMQKYINI